MSVFKNIQSVFLGMFSPAHGCNVSTSSCEEQALTLRYDLICSSVIALGLEPRSPELSEHLCCIRHLVKLYGTEVTALPCQGTYNVLEEERFKNKISGREEEEDIPGRKDCLHRQGEVMGFLLGELEIHLEKVGLVRRYTKAVNLWSILELVERLRITT